MLANMGDKVLLVDADLRRQTIHKLFGMDGSAGLGSVILGQAELFSTIKRVKDHPGLSVLTAGPAFPNPAEVLSSEQARKVLAALRDKYDLIIIDSPPIVPVSDPLILSEMSDGVIIVTKGGATSRVVARKACQSLEKINATIIGVVMNNVKIPKGVYGSYYYSYYRPYGESRKETA